MFVRTIKAAAVVVGIGMVASTAGATADGPDFWEVVGVASNDVLNMRTEPKARSAKLGEIPHDGKGVANYGCVGFLSFAEFEKATPAEREAARKRIWCLVGYGDRIGWSAGRYLEEGDVAAGSHTRHLDDLDGTMWLAIDLAGKTPGSEATLKFEGDGISGNGGCNVYRSAIKDRHNGLSFGPIAATRKACRSTPHDPDLISIAETETRMFDALGKTNEVIQANDILVLLDRKQRVLATLQRVAK